MASSNNTCAICKGIYNATDRKPLVLPCSHSFCKSCLEQVERTAGRKECSLCRTPWKNRTVKSFVFCLQLVPAEPEAAAGNAPSGKYSVDNPSAAEVKTGAGYTSCSHHKNEKLEFWCECCKLVLCKKCLRMSHKGCNWFLVAERIENLELECQQDVAHFTQQAAILADTAATARKDLSLLRSYIASMRALEMDLEMHQATFASSQMECERLVEGLEHFKKKVATGSGNMVEVLQDKCIVVMKLQQLMPQPDGPPHPMTLISDAYQTGIMDYPPRKRAKVQFPATVDGFGYEFKDGRLSDKVTGEGFKFVVKECDRDYNQRHYEAMGEVMTEHIYGLLESECGLVRLPVPVSSADAAARGFVFASQNWKTEPHKLMILIHGSGVVRAGQWARRLIINDCLDSGTQMPFIKRAMQEGYAVLVLNCNQNSAHDLSGNMATIIGSENPSKHAGYVWRHYVQAAAAKHIAIVAHSYGGVVTTELYREFRHKDFKERVFAIAMTDSVHFIQKSKEFFPFTKMARNWVTSNQPLDANLSHNRPKDVPCVSAGVETHEMTSWASIHSIFKFFRDRLQKKTGEVQPEGAGDDASSSSSTAGTGDVVGEQEVDGGSQTSLDRAVTLPASGSSAEGHGHMPQEERARDLSVPFLAAAYGLSAIASDSDAVASDGAAVASDDTAPAGDDAAPVGDDAATDSDNTATDSDNTAAASDNTAAASDDAAADSNSNDAADGDAAADGDNTAADGDDTAAASELGAVAEGVAIQQQDETSFVIIEGDQRCDKSEGQPQTEKPNYDKPLIDLDDEDSDQSLEHQTEQQSSSNEKFIQPIDRRSAQNLLLDSLTNEDEDAGSPLQEQDSVPDDADMLPGESSDDASFRHLQK